MASRHFTISNFYCLKCGKTGVPIARKDSKQRIGDHLKKIYCVFCKEEVNHLERRPFDQVSDEQFKIKLDMFMKIEEANAMLSNEKVLYIMIGAPGSGKSYFTKKAVERNPLIKVISRDAIRFSLLDEGDDYFSKESLVFATYIANIQKELDRGVPVIADATHISTASRRKLLNHLNTTDYKVVGVVVKTSLETCLERNRGRKGRSFVPEADLKHMYSFTSAPDDTEPFDQIIEINGESI